MLGIFRIHKEPNSLQQEERNNPGPVELNALRMVECNSRRQDKPPSMYLQGTTLFRQT